MFNIDQSEVLDGEFTDTAAVTSTALVPLAVTTHWAPKIPLPHGTLHFWLT